MEFTKEELDNEIWKDIIDYEGLYQVSDLGRVKSLDRIIKNTKNVYRKIKERILKDSFDKDGYRIVVLSKHGKQKCKRVHRLVLMSFVSISELEVDHINEIKDDNRLVNLRYCTNRENIHFYRKYKSIKLLGVSLSKEGKWKSSIKINNISYHLGTYETETEASFIYNQALYNWEKLKILPEPFLRKGSSKYKYISYHSRDKKWIIKYKNKHYGYFQTEEEAYKKLLNIIDKLNDEK